jgi:hypothetical protein
MAYKQTYAQPNIWQPDVDDNDTTANGVPAKAVATSGIEVAFLKLSTGGGSAVVSVHDCAAASEITQNNKKWVLDTSTTDNDINPFPNPLNFKKGMVFVLEQGSGNNPVISYSIIPSSV